jgi:hypothetical protein
MLRLLGKTNRILLPLAALSLFTACAPQSFAPVDGSSVEINTPQGEEISSNFFKLSDSQAVFQQEELDQNKTSLSFQVRLPDGTFVNDLKASDITVTENGIPFSGFQMSSNSQNIVQTVDIVFAVDVTGSMAPTIESAKSRLINFVQSSRARGYHTRMCLSTFGDYTVQRCNRFYDNNPDDPSTEAQITELISEISKLRALSGSQDPGGYDLNENPMRALIDASQAPWATSSQRFLILITDDGFLYSPGNQGAVGSLAPKYTEVMSALASSQMTVFAVTPSLAGYNKKFSGSPGIVEASNGEHFLFSDLIAGRITLDTVLNRIIARVKTTYLVEYTVDQIRGLDPSLPLPARHIEVVLSNGMQGTVVVQGVQSNLPNGRPQYKKSWKLDDKSIRSAKVKVNGVEVSSGFKIENGSLVFDQPPAAGAKIEISYQFESIKDNLKYESILLGKNEDLNALQVFFNGMKARGPDVVFEQTLEGRWTVRPSEKVLSSDDPFRIRDLGGLSIKIIRIKK